MVTYRIEEDCGPDARLLTDSEECTQALINLLLTGHAVPYIHNGNMDYDEHGQLLVLV